METIILGGGCFWCLEAVFDQIRGVSSVESGYMGGRVPHPSYREVCSGATGHAEVIRVAYDPAQVSIDDLLDVFFAIHDPTTPDRQGNDIGSQSRSAIFYSTEAQRDAAQAKIQTLDSARVWPDPIVTQLTPTGDFWIAEDYHQEYFAHNGNQPYCAFVVAPKVTKFQKLFARLRKSA